MEQQSDGGPTTVACPACQHDVLFGLPHSAVVVSVTNVSADDQREDESDASSRYRHVWSRCPNDHPVAVCYDW
ncbi:hypothetical protein [Natrarchaeobaculum sulfurireducens]|uniref:Uncharacterized protein n=1 Tax=Natrarchaeobaculum sulfurireducens TaxID=2044521 RepID=A0A346PT36_9EURY|nr:hypothetical protein [Natrarchaeobaculum sulfurireducens]AXR82681.1 hypothetical protein AArcMg_2691 [Natrarchaeobaculum sulfurireducens]